MSTLGRDGIWEPPPDRVAAATLTTYADWLGQRNGKSFLGYDELHTWSTANLAQFWSSIPAFFGCEQLSGVEPISGIPAIGGEPWFRRASVNWASEALKHPGDQPAISSWDEMGLIDDMDYSTLRRRVGGLQIFLRELGLGPGDGVAAILPNRTEAIISFLAVAAIGGIWSICAPDFGALAAIRRFENIQPKILIASTSHRYRGVRYDTSSVVQEVADGLRDLTSVILVPGADLAERVRVDLGDVTTYGWDETQSTSQEPSYTMVPGDHPLWVVYTSGTTGPPKAIAHSHAGVLAEQLKSHGLHLNLSSNDTLFWYSTTGWIMWNFVLGALVHGAKVVLYDGHPMFPDVGTLWKIAEDQRLTHFGASAAFYEGYARSDVRPNREYDLGALRILGSTGSPLSSQSFSWAYSAVSDDILIASISGGTDVATAFVGCVPTLPVNPGEIQRPWLGVDAQVVDPTGNPASIGVVGELVIDSPMPSMPTHLIGDTNGHRFQETYLSDFPGRWRQGDLARRCRSRGWEILGRSDGTINRGGIRIGTSEIYTLLEGELEIADSLLVHTRVGPHAERVFLFVSLNGGDVWSDQQDLDCRALIRERLSARHVPDIIVQVPAIPRTLTGKKLEVPVRRILEGEKPSQVAEPAGVIPPGVLNGFATLYALSWEDGSHDSSTASSRSADPN